MAHGKDKDWGKPKPDREKGERVYSDGTSYGEVPPQQPIRVPLDSPWSNPDKPKNKARVIVYHRVKRIVHVTSTGNEIEEYLPELELYEENDTGKYYHFK